MDESTSTFHTAQLINGYEPSFHIPLGAMGNVENLSIVINDPLVTVQEIHVNVPLPWVFMWLRVFLLTTVVMLIWLWRKHKFSELEFKPHFGKHLLLDAGVVAGFIGILFLVMLFP